MFKLIDPIEKLKAHVSSTRIERLEPLLRWLSMLIAIALLACALYRLWPFVSYILARNESSTLPDDIDAIELGTSRHFRVLGPSGYMSEGEVESFLDKVEQSRELLLNYLGIPNGGPIITMRLHQQDGVPLSLGPTSINLYAVKAGHTSVIHELTHSLMGYRNSFISEGLAVFTEEQFGWGVSFPNWARPVEAHLYAWLQSDQGFIPLLDLWKKGTLWDPTEPRLSRLRYLEAGAFVEHIITAHGLATFLEVYEHSNFQRAYGRSLEELEREWLSALRVNYLQQALIVTIGGLAFLVLTHLAITRTRLWIPSSVSALLAFFAWSFYFVYPLHVPVSLFLAVTTGFLVSRWSHRWGIVSLWLIGLTSLVIFMLIPPIAFFL